ncbi:LysR family transcriptional regulator [Bacillus thermocopriae]|uniref:LysR family transcriptional regulator n=1 Tax=Neobacillus thermocopriae TaxID=1215031 RepID=A0A6B3TQ60_9BACI|nr:LysR family transcriptional regulator [Neobacillus thermocopriae]MED3625340.1 LysR family transcriptional regulator [Neobacillus thermocopriae]MED3714104.1 LysR family transcriptional regulator [Neobacillus thermocopriae]NEX77887.1 LysR family transcriptional regulator [Neobacillus thermocopriae]
MELRNLRTFQVVAEELNMTKAAKRLKYTQPTITLQIQSLEKELNHTLITRVGKKTMLTTAGKKLKEHVDHLFVLLEKMERDMESLRGPSGILTIAASEYYCTHHLSPLIKTYMEMYPEVKVRLLPLNSVHAIQSVKDQVADMAIIASECNESELRKTFLEEEQTLLVVSEELARGRAYQEIVSEYSFISYNEDCSFSRIIDYYFKNSQFQPRSTIMVGGSDEMIKRAVLNGTGYAILGENIIKKEIEEGLITVLEKIDKPIITSAIHLKFRSNEPNIETFHEFLQNAWPVHQE